MNVASVCTSAVLVGISGLHVAWALGSSFPCSDRESLADTVAGTETMAKAPETVAVAASLLGAATLVADALPIGQQFRNVGVAGAALILGTRGVFGVLGRTSAIVPWTPSARFTELDKRYYGPLCLALSAGAVSSLRSG